MSSLRIIVNFIVLLTCVLSVSCTLGEKEKIIEETFYTDGTIKSVILVFNGDSSRHFRNFYPNGMLKDSGSLDENGNCTGVCVEYYPTGSKKSECEYNDGLCQYHEPNKDNVFLSVPIGNDTESNQIYKMHSSDTCIVYKNSKIVFYPYADGIPYGMYKILIKPHSIKSYSILKPNSDDSNQFEFSTIDLQDTIDIVLIFPDERHNIVVEESPSVNFSFIVE